MPGARAMIDFLMLRRIAFVGLTSAGALALFLAWYSGLWPAVAVYACVAFALALAMFPFDRSGGLSIAIAALTLGPFAGPVMLLAARGPALHLGDVNAAEDVPQPTTAQRIYDEIAQGRRPSNRASAVPALDQVFAFGSLCHQQTALDAMARQYTPQFGPALDRALASEIPAVRVQTAAILAHLRDSFTARARALLADETGLSGSALAAEISALSASGFIDAATITELARHGQGHGPAQAGAA